MWGFSTLHKGTLAVFRGVPVPPPAASTPSKLCLQMGLELRALLLLSPAPLQTKLPPPLNLKSFSDYIKFQADDLSYTCR